MTDFGYATEEYSDEVLTREQRLSTVYDNGISGPHSINQNAEIDSIGLIHLKEAVYYEEKYVKTIFMINLKKGHMFLYQDVSDLILWVIESHQKLNEVLAENKYSSFIRMLKER